jgi:hypothetical protein
MYLRPVLTKSYSVTSAPRKPHPPVVVGKVLPDKIVVDALITQLRAHSCDRIVSIGSGGRLDLERALVESWRMSGRGGRGGPSSPQSLQVTAVDMLDPHDVVDEGVQYVAAKTSCSAATAVGRSAALMVCWGTTAPWKMYIEAMEGPLFLLFSGVDKRAVCHPDPRRLVDVAFLRRKGFELCATEEFKGDSFSYSECRLSCFSRDVRGRCKTAAPLPSA